MERTERRILVVDDDAAIRALLFTILRRRGFRVDTATNGVEALERCARCRYSLILLDLMMPAMNGFGVLGAIEAWPAEERPQVIVLTAGREPRNLNPDLVAGTVNKPFDIHMLVDTIAASIAMREMDAQRESCPPADSENLPSS